MVGIAAMLGTGVFVVFTPAADYAGQWLPLAISVAAVVSICGALSASDLARHDPEADEGYGFARDRLGAWAGRVTGIAALFAKIAAAAAAGLVFGRYVLPNHIWWAAGTLIVVLGVLHLLGVRWTVRACWVLVPSVLAVLGMVVVVGLIWQIPPDWSVSGVPPVPGVPKERGLVILGATPEAISPFGVLTASAFAFFAFAGYARTVAAGERTRAASGLQRWLVLLIPLVSLAIYLAVAYALLHALGVTRLGMDPAPLVDAVAGADAPALGVLVRLGAAAATVASLLIALDGTSRTAQAMATHGDLPNWLTAARSTGRPWRVDVLSVGGALLIAAVTRPVQAVALASGGLLIYYAFLNASALRLPSASRRWPAWTSLLGLVLCVALVALLPLPWMLLSLAVVTVGVVASALYARYAARPRLETESHPPNRRVPPGNHREGVDGR